MPVSEYKLHCDVPKGNWGDRCCVFQTIWRVIYQSLFWILTLQDPGSSPVGSWLFTGGSSQDEWARGICWFWCLLFLRFVKGVWPPHAFTIPPPLCGSHPVAQLRAACWLRPACTAQQRALWVSHSPLPYCDNHIYIQYINTYIHVHACNFMSICTTVAEMQSLPTSRQIGSI